MNEVTLPQQELKLWASDTAGEREQGALAGAVDDYSGWRVEPRVDPRFQKLIHREKNAVGRQNSPRSNKRNVQARRARSDKDKQLKFMMLGVE